MFVNFISVFMSDGGIPCVKEHSEEIKNCFQEKIPDLKDFDPNDALKSISINPAKIAINEETCK